MKKSIISIFTLFIIFNASAQLKTTPSTPSNTLEDRVKTDSNKKEVIELLDILRADLYTDFKQDFVFVVKEASFKKNYSWVIGEAQRKDGENIRMIDNNSTCCRVEALYKKNQGVWHLIEAQAFSKHPWYLDLESKYPDLPKRLIVQ